MTACLHILSTGKVAWLGMCDHSAPHSKQKWHQLFAWWCLEYDFVFGQPVVNFNAIFTMQVALGWPLEDFASAAKAALDAGSVDVVPLQKLAQARQGQLSTIM